VFRKRLSNADFDDLQSAGYTSLIGAVERYDPSRGIPFHGFAKNRVFGSMLDAARQADVLPRHTRQRLKQWQEAVVQFRQVHGYPPTHEDVEAALSLRPGEWDQSLTDSRVASVTLSYGRAADDETSLIDQIACGGPGPLEITAAKDGFAHLLGTDTLTARERTVLRMKYGEDRTFSEIKGLFNCSEATLSYTAKEGRMKIAATLAAA
jgi:RNA polymerase sigma factor FliA